MSDSGERSVEVCSSALETVGVSERERKPVKTLLRASDIVGVSASALKPVKTLETASDIVGVSARDLKPVNNLSATSERGGASERNLPADLLMLSVMPARLSDMLLNPVKTLATASDRVGISA